MKNLRLLQFLSLLVLPLFLSGCGASAASPYSPLQMAEIIIADQYQHDPPALNPLHPTDAYYTDYLSGIYQLKEDWVEDGAIFYSDGTQADEFAVFLLSEDADPAQVEDALLAYIAQRTDTLTGYAPEEAAILKNSAVLVKEDYAALLICSESQAAAAAFLSCFDKNPPALPSSPVESNLPPEPAQEAKTDPLPAVPEDSGSKTDADPASPNAFGQTGSNAPEEAYDPAAILSAWNSGDTGSLSPKNAAILAICSRVIAEVITNDMSDYEKELAIHDWIISQSVYDSEAASNAPDAKPDPNNDNPYGLLMNGKAICSGFTSTFQLFMDMLQIECISVQGGAEGRGEHAWNMVRIDDKWYCVDVTWDVPAMQHTYFNVNSAFMRETQHEWDAATVPEATAPQLYLSP